MTSQRHILTSHPSPAAVGATVLNPFLTRCRPASSPCTKGTTANRGSRAAHHPCCWASNTAHVMHNVSAPRDTWSAPSLRTTQARNIPHHAAATKQTSTGIAMQSSARAAGEKGGGEHCCRSFLPLPGIPPERGQGACCMLTTALTALRHSLITPRRPEDRRRE
jgi:hypothetical protein